MGKNTAYREDVNISVRAVSQQAQHWSSLFFSNAQKASKIISQQYVHILTASPNSFSNDRFSNLFVYFYVVATHEQ